jgi:hypothetical protein
MPKHKSRKPDLDWRVTSFEGSRREQLRRWAQLPLENILLAVEEMQEIADMLGTAPAGQSGESGGVKEPPAPYRGKRSGKKSKQTLFQSR